MKKVIWLMLFCFLFTACNSTSPLEKKLEGTWVIDIEATIDLVVQEAGGVSDAERENLKNMLTQGLGQLVMEFDISQKMSSGNMGEKSGRTPYKVKRESGNKIVLEINGKELEFVFQGDKLEVTLPNARKERFIVKRR